MTTDVRPLGAPVLDPRDERAIVAIALARFRALSGLTVTDAHSPAVALLESQALSHSELLWRANGLAERFSILFLQNLGVQQKLGTRAVGAVRIELRVALATSYSVPAGTRVKSQGGRLYRTTESVTFAQSELARTVTVEAIAVGSGYNLPANAIAGFENPLPFVAGVTNPDPIGGGTDAETDTETRVRGFERIRRRALIRPPDFEAEARSLLGGGIAIALTDFEANAPTGLSTAEQRTAITAEPDTVNVFVANADGSIPSEAQREAIRVALERKTEMTTEVIVRPCDPNPVWIEAIAELAPGVTPSAVASAIRDRLVSYFAVGRYPFGRVVIVNEVEAQCRVAGVDWVQSATLSDTDGLGQPRNLALRYRWSFPQLAGVRLRLVSGGRTFAFSPTLP